MSPARAPEPRAGRGAILTRLTRAWRRLPSERRLAAGAAVGLALTLFLPWYQETVIAPSGTRLQSTSASLTGWGAFSFVEAAVLVVALAVLTLLFQRAEGHPFHLPGGDGWAITAAGAWTSLLVVWRIFDKQGTSSHGQYDATSGIEWGIFVALAAAALLAWAGTRIRAAREPEPPLPGQRDPEPPPTAPTWGPEAWTPYRAPTASDAVIRSTRPRRRRDQARGRDPLDAFGVIDLEDPPEMATREQPTRRQTPDRQPARQPGEPASPAPGSSPGLGNEAATQVRPRGGAGAAPGAGRSEAEPHDQLTIPLEDE